MQTNYIAFDTETHLIAPGRQAPPVVVAQIFAPHEGPEALVYSHHEKQIEPLAASILSGERGLITGHNIAFDMAVLCANYPALIPLVFEAYAKRRIVCTLEREKLLVIAEGDLLTGRDFSLEGLTRRYTPTHLKNAQDPWRLRFGELDRLPVSEMPVEALYYAKNDVIAQHAVTLAQDTRKQLVWQDEPVLEDQFAQAASAFALQLISAWGVHTDPYQVAQFEAQEIARLESHREGLVQAGLVRADGTKNTKAAKAYATTVFEALGSPQPLTEKGEISLSAEACETSLDPTLIAYAEFGTTKTLLARIERLKKGGEFPIQSRFNNLVASGRTSCSEGDGKKGVQGPPSAYGYQLQNPNRKSGVRECFVPRPGYWLLSCDYEGHELRTWSFVCLKMLGYSRMAEVLNAGIDPHAIVAALLARVDYNEAMQALEGALGPDKQKEFKNTYRQIGKIANFGFPGGMGVARFAAQAKSEYGMPLTLETAAEARNAWRNSWPEGPEYHKTVAKHLENTGTIQHLISGRLRGGLTFCDGCNTLFQGLAADIAKQAGFRLQREIFTNERSPLYGSRIWNFAHDEYLLEVPAHPVQATLAGYEVCRIMEATAREYMPELSEAIRVEPALMLRWSKAAKPAFAKSGPFRGCLVPYDSEDFK